MVEGEDYESAMGFVKSRRRQEVVELKRGVGWIPKCINWWMPGALGGRGARSGFQLLSILSNLMLADLLVLGKKGLLRRTSDEVVGSFQQSPCLAVWEQLGMRNLWGPSVDWTLPLSTSILFPRRLSTCRLNQLGGVWRLAPQISSFVWILSVDNWELV